MPPLTTRSDATDFDSHAAFINPAAKPEIVICVFGYLGDQKGQRDWQEASRILRTSLYRRSVHPQYRGRDMAARKSGTIIGISSGGGEKGQDEQLPPRYQSGFTAYPFRFAQYAFFIQAYTL